MDKKLYFPNLNSLRFIAATLVILHHSEQIKMLFGHKNYFDIKAILIVGKLGVILFFVLSGFLITYLFYDEEKRTKRISIRNFYIRRILRIWPLYYLTIILAFFVFPQISIFNIPSYSIDYTFSNIKNLVLYICFLPNLVLSSYAVIPYASHSWSIGTEEQFYLIWPLLFCFFKKFRKIMMATVIVFYLILKSYLIINPKILYGINILEFINTIPIDCMALGGIIASLSYEKNNILKYINNNFIFWVTLILVLVFIFFGISFSYWKYEVYALFFSILILNLSTNRSLNNILESKTFDYLGKISYGLYMYHPILITFSIFILKFFELDLYFLVFPLSLLFTILISAISYKYFEVPFLRLKEKFN